MKSPLSIVICKQWDTGQLLGRKNSIDKMLNHLEVFGQRRDLIIRNKVDIGFELRNVKLIWLFKLGIKLKDSDLIKASLAR